MLWSCYSGALIVECINVLGGSRIASVGDEIVVSVKRARPVLLTSDLASKSASASAGN